MAYWRLFYHMVWSTRDREPLISDSLATMVHKRIAQKATQLGTIVHEVGGMEDHVHLAVSVPPSIALSEFVRQVKGSSSHFMSRELDVPFDFAWQADYGVISLDGKQLAKVIQYVKAQRQHHQSSIMVSVLERVTQE